MLIDSIDLTALASEERPRAIVLTWPDDKFGSRAVRFVLG